MEIKFLEYQLGEGGFIHNWLVAGPHTAPLRQSDPRRATASPLDIPNVFRPAPPELAFSEPPVERGAFTADGADLRWRYVRCRDDHFIHLSHHYPSWTYARAWALTQVQLPSSALVRLEATAYGPLAVWVNGALVFEQEGFAQGAPARRQFQAALDAGVNQIVVRFDQAAIGDCPNLLALQLADLGDIPGDKVRVNIPTQAKRPARWLRLERALEKAYLEKAAYHKGNFINLRWADDLEEQVNYTYQIQDAEGNIYVEGKWDSHAAEPLDIGHPQRLWERPYNVVLQAPGVEFWDQGLRYQRKLPLQVLDHPCSLAPYGSFNRRLHEGLEEAARREDDLYGQIARLQLGQYDQLQPEVVEGAIASVQEGEPGSELRLVGLLGVFYRYAHQPTFPQQLRKSLQACLSAAAPPQDEAQDEGDACLRLAASLLLAQLDLPASSSASLEAHEKAAADWMLERGRYGFRQWGSSLAQEKLACALTHLLSLARSPQVRDTAAVLLDKLFFEMALFSYKGVNGSPQAQAAAAEMKSAQLQATAGLQRVLWGMGVFNRSIAGVVSLACSDYEFPLLIANIASRLPEEAWMRAASLRDAHSGVKATRFACRTPDYLLASAQVDRPGERGSAEHLWQATFSPDALVFVNHPASLGEAEALKPGFWRGNASLPRLAQWRDVLIAIYKLPANDWLGFTHAYFPLYCFDEHRLEQNWAFARLGEGYLALTAARGLQLVKSAPDAYRELRSYGQENLWVCMLGRAAQDGSFADFCQKALALEMRWQPEGVHLATLRGETLDFAWEGALRVNGKEVSTEDNRHYATPYCEADLPANQMDISDGENILRLDFS